MDVRAAPRRPTRRAALRRAHVAASASRSVDARAAREQRQQRRGGAPADGDRGGPCRGSRRGRASGSARPRSARARSPSECVVGIARSARPDGSSTAAGAASDAQRSPSARYGGRARARRAVDVAELGTRLRDLGVGVPAASAEERRREAELAKPRALGDARARRCRRPSAARGRAPSSACGGRAARARPPPARARARPLSSSPNAGSAGRMSAAIAKPPGRARLQAPRTAPRRRRRAVAPRGRRRPRTVPPTWRPSCAKLDDDASTGALVVVARGGAPAARRARARARDDPRGVRRQERPLRDDARRPRDVRLPPRACRPRTRSRCTAGSSPRSTCRSAARGSRSGSRRSSSPSRRRSSSSRSARGCARPGVGLVAALVATLHPYVVWHDVHLNREVLDGLAARAARRSCALAAYEHRSLPLAAATGAVAGLAILGNARLVLLPVALAVYVAWRDRLGPARAHGRWRSWSARPRSSSRPGSRGTRSQVGCFAITTDSRALWKANNPNTRDVLDRGGWIDDVPELAGRAPVARAGRRPHARRASRRRSTSARRCASTATRCSTSGASTRARRRGSPLQATRMLWSPVPRESDASGSGAGARPRGETVEPAFVVGLYVLAHRRASSSRRRTSSRSRCCCSPTTRSPRWSSPERPATALRGTSSSRSSPRSRSPRSGSACRDGDAATRRGLERARVELLDPLDAALGRELRERALAPGAPHGGGAREIARERDDRVRERLGVGGGHDEARLAVRDDLGQPADGARDHRPRPLHRLERDHAEPLAERGHDDDRGVLDRRSARARRSRGSARRRPARAPARTP